MTDLPADDQRVPPESEIAWLRSQIASFERRLGELTDEGLAHLPPPPSAPATMPPPPQMPPPPAPSMPLAPPRWTPAETDPPALTPPPPRDEHAPRDEFGFVERASDAAGEFERQRVPMSLPAIEPLLKWSGLVLLFLSALFLVSTAIQRGWIGPELQLLGAGAIGVALIGGGLVIGRRRAGWDVPLVAVGIAVLSATATAGWEWLELRSYEPWIVASFAVLAVSVVFTQRLHSPGVGAAGVLATVVSMGLLGASTSEAAVLIALVIAVSEATSLWRRLAALHLSTVAVGLVAYSVIAAETFMQDEPASTAVLLSGAAVTLMFWLMPLAASARPSLPSKLGIDWRPTVDRLAISLPGLFATAWAWSSNLSDDDAGRAFLLVGALALVSSAMTGASGRFQRSVWVSQLMGGSAAVTIGLVLWVDGPGLLAGLALQAAALLVFVHVLDDRWATMQAWAMAFIAGLLALSGMTDAIEIDAPAIDDVVHLGVVLLAAAWAAWELQSVEGRRLGTFLAGIAFGGAVLWPVSALIHVPQGQALISAAWASLGFAALVAAFTRSSIRLAQISLVTLGVVMVKLLTVDLAAVDTFWRVALFFVLGGTFLFASFRVGTVLQSLDSDTTQDPPDDEHPDQESGLAFQK